MERKNKSANKLEEEVGTLHVKLSEFEIELERRNVELKAVKVQKDQIVGELNHFQKQLKEAETQRTAAEDAEAQAKIYTKESKTRMTRLEASAKESASTNKSIVSQLQQEICKLKNQTKHLQEKLESSQEESRFKDDFIKQLEDAKERVRREYSSKFANLEQALQCEKGKEKEIKLQLREAEDQLFACQREDNMPGKKSDSSNMAAILTTPQQQQKHHSFSFIESELEDLKAENSKLKKDYEFFHDNYSAVCEKSRELKQVLADKDKEIEHMQHLLDAMSCEKESFEQQVGELQAKLNAQLHQQEDKEKRTESAGQQRIQDLQRQLERTNDQLIDRVSKLHLSRQMVDELKLELRKVREKNAADQPDVEQLYQEMLALQKELEVANLEKKGAGDRVAALIHERETILTCKDEITKENEALQNKVKALELDFAELHSKFDSLNAVSEEALDYSDDTSEFETNASKTPGKPLAVVEELHGKLQSVGSSNQMLKQECLSSKSSRDLLQVQLKGAKQAMGELKKEIKCIESTSTKIGLELSQTKSTLESTQGELESKKKAFSKKEAERASLEKKSNLLKSQVQEAESHAEMLEGRLEELESENFEVTSSLVSAQEEVNTAKSRVREFARAVEKLEKRLALTKTEVVEKEDLVKELTLRNDLMEGENISLLSQISVFTQTIREKNNHLFNAEDKLKAQKVTAAESDQLIASLDQTLKDTHHAQHSSAGQIQQLKAFLVSSKDEAARAKNANGILQEDLKDKCAEIKSAQQENSLLESRLKDALQKIGFYAKQIAELEIQSSCASRKLESELQVQQKQLQEQVHKNREVLVEQAVIKQNYEELQNTYSTMRNRCANLQDSYGVLKEQSLTVGNEYKDLRQHLQSIQQSCSQLRAEKQMLENSQGQLSDTVKQKEELEVKVTEQSIKIKQLAKNNEHLTRKYRCLQEDFENIQGDYGRPAQLQAAVCHSSEATTGENLKSPGSSSDPNNKVLFAVQNTMTVSYK